MFLALFSILWGCDDKTNDGDDSAASDDTSTPPPPVMPTHWETLPSMATLLADLVRNPTFPQDEIELLKANTAQGLQAQLASPQYVNNRVYRA